LETTALDLVRGRIFLATVRDSHGLAAVLEAPAAADEPRPIRDLLVLHRKRDPDVLENPNLFGSDLPFLEVAPRRTASRSAAAALRRAGPGGRSAAAAAPLSPGASCGYPGWGVAFALPAGWDEAQERALVAEVAARLPLGIRLDYNGR
jgi:hypothetical protein